MRTPTGRWYTPDEVAQMMNVGRSTVDRWVKTKALPAFVHHRTVRIHEKALAEFIFENETV